MDAELAAELSDDLRAFLEANPEARLDGTSVLDPWGDSSVAFRLPARDPQVVEALNNVRLWPRFTGVFHRDTQGMEFIGASYAADSPLVQRVFTFQYNGYSYTCKWAPSSDRLTALARVVVPAGTETDSSYRNLVAYRLMLDLSQVGANQQFTDSIHLSFYVQPFPTDEAEQIALVRSLNFFMTCYDRGSPRVMVHASPGESPALPELRRLTTGQFPGIIAARPVDTVALDIWESVCATADPRLQLLHSYQILEYEAFYTLSDSVTKAVRRHLASLAAMVDAASAIRAVVDEVVQYRSSDEDRINTLVHDAVGADSLWEVVQQYEQFFTVPTAFDGGFVVDPLIRSGWTVDDFRTGWYPKLPDAIRRIRNAVVHSREARSSQSITPGRANATRLRPWAAVAVAMARDVMLFAGVE